MLKHSSCIYPEMLNFGYFETLHTAKFYAKAETFVLAETMVIPKLIILQVQSLKCPVESFGRFETPEEQFLILWEISRN
jgi:hypothetical protein